MRRDSERLIRVPPDLETALVSAAFINKFVFSGLLSIIIKIFCSIPFLCVCHLSPNACVMLSTWPLFNTFLLTYSWNTTYTCIKHFAAMD